MFSAFWWRTFHVSAQKQSAIVASQEEAAVNRAVDHAFKTKLISVLCGIVR